VVAPPRRQLAIAGALLVLIMVVVVASTVPSSPPRHTSWAGPPDAVPSATGGDDLPPSDGSPSPGHPTPSAPTPGPSGSFAGRLPKFGPAPAAQPIHVPGGPYAPIYKRLPVTQPVAFLTIDDGWFQLPNDPELMREAHIPFTMFLIGPVAAKNPAFFNQLEAAGGVVEDHTVTHPELKGKSYEFQRHEICDARTSLEHTFSTTLQLFRPPFGDYDQTTLRAVHDCGLKAAFYWSETVNNGAVAYQTAEHQIHAGDIILMHFRPAFTNDVIAALTAIHNAGLTPALLEDYIS
jgi:peptidoglycan/xylan/chitin deacetylase (PgdA/CDA1 family)